ncbi:NrfD/PsrC family molybdoenzyme membrane anchor subunit [Aestuariirhabdus litorea]|uniref:Polysulfide reductase n=1 Tax=Aestuariirhabdus litorea TaxID=2528527 RepID=A0A3P3VKE6_9GAMM|nr:NrfD/PsrC family molybdoenzyme membrane anchor subunit [Aestuariirhabdus litorea]RRJ82787.1 polysulfide reductase [Aestuariirhabdus litorea]RWW92946.1 polysulfide reductase [Endozoicomonadaceae bacterium GTF-13]
METIAFAGLDINKVSIKKMFFNKAMLLAYFLLFVAVIGLYQVFDLRYFGATLNSHSAGMDPTSPELKEAMRQAIFGSVGEINRNLPWTALISNYMFMLYTGSGIIFLVALAELMKVKAVEKVAVGYMVVGVSMVFAGLFTITTDLHVLNGQWLFLTPNTESAIWMMMPLYLVYIPFVLFEIYLLLTNKRALARRLALVIVLMSIGIDFIEYYIQASLFAMNTARHLWTEFPALTFYFIVSSFVAALGVMGVYTFLVHRSKSEYQPLMDLVRHALFVAIILLGVFEFIAYMSVDEDWTNLILFGPFSSLYFVGYVLFTFVLSLLFIVKPGKPMLTVVASIFVILGGYIGRIIFVYGGNAVPMSNRFGTGFEKKDMYGVTESFIYSSPHLGEVLIVLGSVGVALITYKLFDGLFSVGISRDHS